jgi:U3 small nucleolar RNA-associated protein MPP10
VWDDVVRKEKPKEEVFEYKKRLTLDHEKSKLSLAEVYEHEYLKQNQVVFPLYFCVNILGFFLYCN